MKCQNVTNFWTQFSLDFAFNIGVSLSAANTPYSLSEPNESAIVNRQCGGEKLKYVPKFWIGSTGHVISRMRSDDLHLTGALEPNISKTLGDRLSYNGAPIGNGVRGVEWSRDR